MFNRRKRLETMECNILDLQGENRLLKKRLAKLEDSFIQQSSNYSDLVDEFEGYLVYQGLVEQGIKFTSLNRPSMFKLPKNFEMLSKDDHLMCTLLKDSDGPAVNYHMIFNKDEHYIPAGLIQIRDDGSYKGLVDYLEFKEKRRIVYEQS